MKPSQFYIKTSLVEQALQGNVLITILRLRKIPHPPAAPGTVFRLHHQTRKTEPLQDLHRLIGQQKHELTFETEAALPALEKGVAYGFQPWWTPDQLSLAYSSAGDWEPKNLRRRKVQTQAEGKPRSQGWDHEHCGLCWQTLSPLAGCEAKGFTHGTDWLCEACYQRFIASGFGKRLGEKITR